MEKQIEEMARIVGSCEGVDDKFCLKHQTCALCKAERVFNADYRKQSDVVNKICCEIKQEIAAALESNYKAEKQNRAIDRLYMHEAIMGKITALRGIDDFISELKKKYTEN